MNWVSRTKYKQIVLENAEMRDPGPGLRHQLRISANNGHPHPRRPRTLLSRYNFYQWQKSTRSYPSLF